MRVLALLLMFALWLAPLPGAAQDLSALARLLPERSALTVSGGEVQLRLQISRPVPWRLRFLDAPPRLVIDTREVD